jgi:hypothetical protein
MITPTVRPALNAPNSPILHPATKTSMIAQSSGNLQLDVVLHLTEQQTLCATGAQQKSHPPSPLLLVPLIIPITLLTLVIHQIDPSFALALDLIHQQDNIFLANLSSLSGFLGPVKLVRLVGACHGLLWLANKLTRADKLDKNDKMTSCLNKALTSLYFHCVLLVGNK